MKTTIYSRIIIFIAMLSGVYTMRLIDSDHLIYAVLLAVVTTLALHKFATKYRNV